MAGDGPADAAPTIALFVTCVVDVARPQVAEAAVHLLRDAGAEVSCPEGQTCCGQPAWNAGFTTEAAAVAAASLDALERDPATHVVVPAGSCATMIRRYWPQLFALAGRPDDAERAEALGRRVMELSELLTHLGPHHAAHGHIEARPHQGEPAHPTDPSPPSSATDASGRRPVQRPVAYHRSCHLERELHVIDQPVALLTHATGGAPAVWPADDRCCGFGGTFSVRLPEVSVAMADDKLDQLPEGVDTVVGCDTSCLLHLEARARDRGLDLRFRHLAEVLADGLDPAAAPPSPPAPPPPPPPPPPPAPPPAEGPTGG